MTDELILQLKLESDEGNKKIQDSNKQVKALNKSSKETASSIGLADTKVGKLWISFKTGAKTGINSMKTLKGAIAATGIGLLIIAVTSLTSWFTKTERGAQQLRIIMGKLNTTIGFFTDKLIALADNLANLIFNNDRLRQKNDELSESYDTLGDTVKSANEELIKSNDSTKESLLLEVERVSNFKKFERYLLSLIGIEKDRVKWTDELNEKLKTSDEITARQNQLILDRRENLVEEGKTTRDLAAIKLIMDDATKTELERLVALNKAQELQNQISDERVRLAKEAFEIQRDLNAQGEDSETDKDKLAQLERDLLDVETERSERLKEFSDKENAIIKSVSDKKQTAHDEQVKRIDELREKENKILEEKAEEYEKEYEAFVEKLDKEDELILEKYEEEEEAFDEHNNKLLDSTLKRIAEEEKAEEDAAILKQALMNTIADVAFSITNIIASNYEVQKQRELKAAGDDEEKKEEIELKFAKKNQELAVKEALISTALMVLNAAQTQPFIPLGLLAVISAVAIGASQVIAIKSQSFRDGGWIAGDSHANGGVNLPSGINAENEEFIVNARTMRNPRMAQDVMKLNAAGNAGFETSVSTTMSPEQVAEVVAASIEAIPVVVTENQITTAQRNVIVREDRFTVGQTNNN